MGFFGKDKPEPVETPVVKPQNLILDDKAADALPRRSSFFNAMRTDAFVNHNIVENYVEFWAALQVDKDNDKWRVMHYMVYDLDRRDGKFVSEAVTKQDVSFAEAVAQIAKKEYTARGLITHADFDIEKQYPAAQFPEMKVHFYDLEHYKKAANIEGFTFGEYNTPRKRVEGRVINDDTYLRSEIGNSILAVEQARNHPQVQAKIEGGILSDLFATASDRAASLDNILKIGQVLSTMDGFADQVGGFYVAIQQALKESTTELKGSARKDEAERFDKALANLASHADFARIEGLSPEEKADAVSRAKENAPGGRGSNGFRKILDNLIPQMNSNLDEAKSLGVHVEPFQKFAAELELYTNLLYASQNLAKLERGFASASNSDTNLITEIRQSVDRAQKKFMDLGGTQDQMDKLKAWVANPNKDPIPGWVPGFLTRYYTSRGNVMAKVQDRQAGLRQVNTMSVEVKPPLLDDFNSATPKQPAANGNDKPVATPAASDNADNFEKYKNITGTSRPPKP